MTDPTEKALNDAVQAFSRQISDQMAETETRAAKAERRIHTLEKRLEQEKAKRREKVQSTRKSARSLERKSEKLRQEIEQLNRTLVETQQEKQRLHRRSQALTEQVVHLSEDHQVSTELFEHAQRELDKRQRTVREIAQKHRETRADLQTRIAEIEKALDARGQDLEAARKIARARARGLTQAKREAEKLSQRVEALDRELEAARTAAERDGSMANRLREELQAERMARENIEQREQSERERMQSEIASLQKKNRTLAQDRERLRKHAEEERTGREAADRTILGPQWRVRDAAGTEYGPATLSELQDWAANCRIGPAHQVSADGEQWTAAADLAALGMEWVADLPDGSLFGPFHLKAVHHLVQTGSIRRDQSIRHLRTQETRAVSDIVSGG